jgi:CBS domain-containing protein
MKTIKQILAERTRQLITVTPDSTVFDAAKLMHEKEVGAVMVVDGKKLVGIFTERDCLHKITAEEVNPRETKVRDIMTGKVRFVTPALTVSQGLALMTERHFRHLPVLDDQENILGIVSIGDLVKEKISEQSFIIEQMERYIST